MIGELLKKAVPTYAAKPYKPINDGKFHFTEGRRGRGKSYSFMYCAYESFKRRVPVRSNYAIDTYRCAIQLKLDRAFPTTQEAYTWLNEGGWTQIQSWDDIFGAMDCELHLDEAQQYVNTRAFRETPKEFLEWGRQSRKVGVTVRLGSQSFEFVDFQVRRLVDILWLARIVPNKKTGVPLEFWHYGIDPFAYGFSESVTRDHADFRMVLPFRRDVAVLYDTLELIAPPTGQVTFASVMDAYKGRRSKSGGRLAF